ncbi:MAG: polymerase, sigma-24 subunit, subfamily [Verrucomicrobiales bacterium]|nr:polymerase, sigma-24 subunit, subfamily [Verrucomicrobiales bacterium]
MNDQTDSELLQAYAEKHSEAAFTELVRRHVDFVYSAARRMVCDPHLAEDVTQGVFVAFANNAGHLADRSVLSGWLHCTTRNIAAQTVRTIERRRAREEEAAAMNELISSDSEPAWNHIAPHLDAALGELNDRDRDALLLRYFERKSAREIAQTLGVSDDAAQKRVTRAVERLRESFAKQGFTIAASGLIAVISANAVQAAPVGLVITILKALAGTTVAAIATTTLTTAILMTTLQKALITATIVAVGVGIYEAREISSLRHEVRNLQQQNADKLAQLTSERDRIIKEQATWRKENERLSQNTAELLQLRGKLGVMQRQREVTQTVAKQELPIEEIPAVTNAPAVYSAKVQAQVKWDHAIAIGGWKMPSGKRMIYFAEPKRETDASQLLLKFQTLECSDEVARKFGLENVLTDNQESLASSPLTSKQYADLATPQSAAQAAARTPGDGAMKINTLQMSTLSGRQAQMRMFEGTLDILPTITADGESVDMAITVALTPHDPVPE